MTPTAPYRFSSLLVAASLVLGVLSPSLEVLCSMHGEMDGRTEMQAPCHGSASEAAGPQMTPAAEHAPAHGCCTEHADVPAVPGDQEVRCCIVATAQATPATAPVPPSSPAPVMQLSGNPVHAPPPSGVEALGAAAHADFGERPLLNRQAVLATFLI